MNRSIGHGQTGKPGEKRMTKGDLVIFSPKKVPGALTAVKYINRINKEINKVPGVILEVHNTNCKVAFGQKILVINKDFLEVI